MIYDAPEAATRRLQELGVAIEALQRAVTLGHAALITCTDHDPPQSPGTDAWRYTVRGLRDELIPRGAWRKADPGNFSLIINDTRKINIVVESGDRFTRVAHVSPRTKSIKGLYMEAVALRNNLETDLFPETVAEDLRRVAALLEYPTYVLLIFIRKEGYRAELSLPDTMESNQVVSWKERIFIPDNEDPFGQNVERGPDSNFNIDINVRKKA